MNKIDKQYEIHNAALKGIRNFLDSIRGAAAFGANPQVTTEGKYRISIIASDGEMVEIGIVIY